MFNDPFLYFNQFNFHTISIIIVLYFYYNKIKTNLFYNKLKIITSHIKKMKSINSANPDLNVRILGLIEYSDFMPTISIFVSRTCWILSQCAQTFIGPRTRQYIVSFVSHIILFYRNILSSYHTPSVRGPKYERQHHPVVFGLTKCFHLIDGPLLQRAYMYSGRISICLHRDFCRGHST